jgi:chemotaxis protein methyltransferase CheR
MTSPTGDDIARFAAAVGLRLGLRVDLERAGDLLGRRAAAHHEPVAAYLDRVDHADAREIRALVSELTVGETYFLRHIEQFRAFIDGAAPDRLGRGRLRVLSIGCSSGEEPYTLAMVLRDRWPAAAFAVHAIDLNPKAIARARAGRYSQWSLRAVPPELEQRWFRRDGQEVVVAPEIRAAVTFENANVLDGGLLAIDASWDVVFCRNMMMYLTEEAADALIARLGRAIGPGGYLFLGHAESLRGRTDDFALRHTHGSFYYQRHLGTAVSELPDAPGIDCVVEPAPATSDAGWYEDIRAATARVHAMVDGALEQTHRREPRLLVDPAPAPIPGPGQVPAQPAVLRPDLGDILELLAQERFAEALARLNHLGPASAADRETVMLRAVVLTHAGRFADARAACTELLAVDGASSGANYLLALCCDSTGDTDGAAQLATRAAELDPSFAMPRVHLGLLARRSGNRELASRELKRAIALLEREAPARLALYGGGFSRHTLLGMCRAELAAIGAAR